MRRRRAVRAVRYGVVVLSVKVSVLLYAPVRSASFALICWLNCSATESLETGPLYVSRFSGEALDPTLLYAVPVLAALRARACSACGSENAPLTRWPVAVLEASATLRSASPAVEMTLAVVADSYVLVTPGVKAPNEAGVPSVRLNVAGTVPPAS